MVKEKFNIAAAMAQANNQTNGNVLNQMLNMDSNRITYIPYQNIDFGEWKKYHIDEREMLDLVDSLLSLGLEQNLVVKETDIPGKFIIVTGHKRLTAINYIFDKHLEIGANPNVLSSLKNPACVTIPKEEDHLITRLRMHETNVQARMGFALDEIEDYFQTIQEIKKQGLEINGKKIKGKSRELLMQHFQISDGTAKKYISILKNADETLKEKINKGEISINNAYDLINQEASSKEKKKKEKTNVVKSDEYNVEDLKQDIIKTYLQLENTLHHLKGNSELKNASISNDYTVKEFMDEYVKVVYNKLQEICSYIEKNN